MELIVLTGIFTGGVIPVMTVIGWFLNHIFNTFGFNFWNNVGMVAGLDMSSIKVNTWWYHTLFGFCFVAICWVIRSIFRRK